MLYDQSGDRKYLTPQERRAFIASAERATSTVSTFCLALVYTGGRISEVLAISPRRVDFSVQGIVIESLKKRRRGIFRTIPVPERFLSQLESVHGITAMQVDHTSCDQRLWPWCRTTAWHRVKEIMQEANILGTWGVPKGLRHGLAVEGATEAGIPLNVIQRWLGHSRIETTAIYANAVGREERNLASRMWQEPLQSGPGALRPSCQKLP